MVYMLLGTGFEETEAIAPLDLLRRAGVDILTVGVTGKTVSDIDMVAVSNGPGSFTGVRIGVSVAKGIAFPDDLPCMAVSTLESMAYNLVLTDCVVCAVMDARCNQVYTATFDCLNGEMKRLTEDEAITIDELTERLKTQDKQIVLIGDGANVCYNKMKDELPNIEIAPLNIRYQSASSVCIIASEMLEKDENLSISPDELLPCYLRLSQAERELKNKNK